MVWSWDFFFCFWNLISSQASCVLWNRNVSQRDKGLMQTGVGQRSELGGGVCVCVCVCEWRRRRTRGVEGQEGCCYENSHKDRLSMIKGLVMLCKHNWRKKKKKNNPKKKKKIIKKGPKQDSQFQPEWRIKMCSKWSHGSSEGLDCSQINQDKLMRSRAAERGNERQQRTKAQLTQLCYHLYVGSTFFFLTEWNQWQ